MEDAVRYHTVPGMGMFDVDGLEDAEVRGFLFTGGGRPGRGSFLSLFASFSLHRSSRPRSPLCADLLGGGGSCRRQGKSAAPEGPCGVVDVVG